MHAVRLALVLGTALLTAAPLSAQTTAGLTSADLSALESVGDVQLSPDGSRVAYAVVRNDKPGRPYSDVWIRDLKSGATTRLESGSGIRWSPDGRHLAFFGRTAEGSGLVVADVDGGHPTLVAPVTGTNHPLPSAGERLSWSPDSRQLAYVSATPGPETENANGDPMVITRYLYKPTASEGETRFNDNRRLHIFVADIASKAVRQLTDGVYYEHSIDWSPKGDEILFVSNRESDPDRFFNYDIFAVRVRDGDVRRLTRTKSAEYAPSWSPDGARIAFTATTRELTSSETTMEDTHVWTMRGDGSDRRELGVMFDTRQASPQWSSDGRHVWFTMQERGTSKLMRLPLDAKQASAAEAVVEGRGTMGAWSLGATRVAYAYTTPERPADLFIKEVGTRAEAAVERVTALNRELLDGRRLAAVESLAFESYDGTEIEAFLTVPPSVGRGTKHPMIVAIHGGPHGQQGPAFNSKAQVYAGLGWATLMVNYRGSTGYGQRLTDAIFGDQDGGEAKDVLAGVDAALAKYSWIDGDRLGIEGGSYGGQLTNWIITQTPRFKAAIPAAGISNLVSFNYMAYYHDYLAVEFGAFPHQRNVIDKLWERSPLRLAKDVKTPTMFVHGENDNDVPIAEAEQFYVALHEVGVETMMVRYPREGHGLRETGHIFDALERSIRWYQRHFERRDR